MFFDSVAGVGITPGESFMFDGQTLFQACVANQAQFFVSSHLLLLSIVEFTCRYGHTVCVTVAVLNAVRLEINVDSETVGLVAERSYRDTSAGRDDVSEHRDIVPRNVLKIQKRVRANPERAAASVRENRHLCYLFLTCLRQIARQYAEENCGENRQ